MPGLVGQIGSAVSAEEGRAAPTGAVRRETLANSAAQGETRSCANRSSGKRPRLSRVHKSILLHRDRLRNLDLAVPPGQ